MYYIEKSILRILFFLFSTYRIDGRRNVPREGPVLVVANHLSIADPPAIGIFLGRRSVFLAKEEVFRFFLFRFFVRNFGAIPVYKGGGNRDALRRASNVLAAGKVLVLFPEGTRGLDGHMQHGQVGAALLAYHQKALIVPVGITGTEKIRGMSWLWQRANIHINIGRPFRLPAVDGDDGHDSGVSKEKLVEYTYLIMNHIAALLPKRYRGEYTGEIQNSKHDMRKKRERPDTNVQPPNTARGDHEHREN